MCKLTMLWMDCDEKGTEVSLTCFESIRSLHSDSNGVKMEAGNVNMVKS